VRRGIGAPVRRGAAGGGAGTGVTALGATCGALSSTGTGVATARSLGNARPSTRARASQLTWAPRQRANGASRTSGTSSSAVAAGAMQTRAPRRACKLPSGATATRSAKAATRTGGPKTRPSWTTAAGTEGTNEPSTSTLTTAANATGR